MSARTFGVEIECGHAAGHPHVAQILRRGPYPEWGQNVGADGSGVEVRSPVLQGEDGFKQIHEVMTYLQAEGAYITNRDGMHTHYGAEDFYDDRQTIIRLVRSWFQNQQLINSFVAPYRRGPGGYGRPLTAHDVERMENDQQNMGPRAALNCSPLQRPAGRRTVEVRQYHGNLDPVAAEAWIRFCQKFIDSVVGRKNPIATCSSVEVLLKRVRTPQSASSHLLTVAPVDPPRDRPVGAPAVWPHF